MAARSKQASLKGFMLPGGLQPSAQASSARARNSRGPSTAPIEHDEQERPAKRRRTAAEDSNENRTSTATDHGQDSGIARRTAIPAFDLAAFVSSLSASPPPPTSAAATSSNSNTKGKAKATVGEVSTDEAARMNVRELLALETRQLDSSWLAAGLAQEVVKPYFLRLKQYLWREGVRWRTSDGDEQEQEQTKELGKVYPPALDIYTWSTATPLDRVKVVIIGQDPYHGPGQAHGLCFSVRPGVAVPPSLRNIYQQIEREFPSFVVPKHGHLDALARQGVLLLNTSLTVRAGQAGSHQKQGWEKFTDKVVDVIDAAKPNGVVFLAWGAWAQKRVAKLDKSRHLILESAHPSPLSAHRGFLGNGHFKKANDWLEQRYGPDSSVDWTCVGEQASIASG